METRVVATENGKRTGGACGRGLQEGGMRRQQCQPSRVVLVEWSGRERVRGGGAAAQWKRRGRCQACRGKGGSRQVFKRMIHAQK